MKRRRITHADKLLKNVVQIFCLLMFLQLKGYYSVSTNSLLLYCTTLDIRVANISKLSKVNTIIKGLEQGCSVNFLYRKNVVCWSDQTAELIQCMNYNGSSTGEKTRIVSDGLITPSGIAIDWYTDKIYWTDGETNRIEVISLDNKHRKVLFWSDVDMARAIVVVPSDGLMFWTDLGEIPKIERAGMNGEPGSRKVIVKDDIVWPNGITVDYTSKLIYWIDTKLHVINVVDFNGNNRKRIVDKGFDYPVPLDFFDDKLYWADLKTGSINMWDITTNGPKKEVLKSDPVSVDVRVYDETRQPLPEHYPCKENNGGCSHLCLLAPNSVGYTCSCPTGVKLIESSNTTCYSGPQSILLIAQWSMLSRISLDSPDYTPYTLPLKDVKKAISVDFDPKTEHIYWTDTMSQSISRARLDGSEQTTIIMVSGVGMPDSIAVDSLARNIYWSDPKDYTISVARLDGSYRKVIIHDDLYKPRAIALHPTSGLMFWSDWNEKRPKIERANLDGSSRVVIISERIAWPNGMAVDTVSNKLYWDDAKTHKIEVCNLDGSERRELHNNDIPHMFGLTILGDQLYWSDIQRRTLESINKYTGGDRQTIVGQMPNMYGLKAFRLGEKLGWNACVDNNGGCSHLCFNRPTDYVCSCPLGLELGRDRKTCIEPEAFLVYSRKNVIGRISIENVNNDAILPLKELKEVSALAVHVAGSTLYWADSKTKSINRCSINGSNMEKLIDWTGLVEGLAVDWSGQNIYWTDSSNQRLEVARLDGSSRRTLIWQGLKKPKSIVLDPKKGQMYWSELGSKSIKRASMDGSSITTLIEQVGRVNALTIDYEKRVLYWAAIEPSTIESAHLDGSNRKKILDDLSMPYVVTVYNDRLFWGDWTTGDIESMKKDGQNRQKIHKKLDFISDLKVYHKSQNAGSNQCAVDNGGCTHLCLAVPNEDGRADYHCGCPTHHKLNKDNLTCSEPEEYLLFAQKNAIGRIVIANGECSDAIIPLTGLKNVKAIEFDPYTKNLYWMEEDNHSIRRIAISYTGSSASDSVSIASGLIRPFHMVLDILGRALYWTCVDGDSINATAIDSNSTSGVVVKDERTAPRHLAFHQTRRMLIWNDVGLNAIMCANADGTEDMELAKASNATALTVDQITGTVYWAMNRQIYAVEIDGTHKRVAWQGVVGVGVEWWGGALWWGGNSLVRLPLRREAPAHPHAHLTKLIALTAVNKIQRDSRCWKGGECGPGPGLCLAHACGCGLGCARICRGHFACALGSAPAPICVPHTWRCDGHTDCPDGSDETLQECGSCANGVRCVDGVCADSLSQCTNGAWCGATFMPEAFRCDDRLCLPSNLLCDGYQHCEDGEDEAEHVCESNARAQPTLASTSGSGAAWLWALCCALILALGVASFALLRRWRRARRMAHCPPPSVRLYVDKPDNRSRPSGASSTDISSQGSIVYPRPTLNPPPSPASPRRIPLRLTRPPPPTPATTDHGDSDTGAHRAPPPSPDPTHY